jgi:predicted metal-binding membrane protein
MSATAATAGVAQDTPRSAYKALERRATLGAVGVLVALAGLAWWSTVVRAGDMEGMVEGFAHAGRAMPFDMSIVVFIGMWTTMMVAMMFPTIAPMVLLHRMVMRRRGASAGVSAAFVAGYIVVWAAIGVVPLLVLLGFREMTTASATLDRVAGGVLVIAGAYQFTRWKAACLKACRTPLSFMMTHDFGNGAAGALRAGVSHGAYCLGCCWR